MKLLILLFLTNIAHATYDPSLQNLQLDMVYSAKVSSAGVVSDENKDWISGNCAVTATNHFDCTYNAAIFTVAPNCTIKDQAVAQTGGFSVLFDNSSSSATHGVYNTYSGVALPYGADPRAVNIICQKQGVDYLAASSAVYSSQNQNTDWALYTPTYSAGFGTVATSYVYWRRNGDTLELQGTFVTGTVAASAATLTIPAGLTIDTAKLAGGGQPILLGFGGRFAVGVPNTLSVIYGSSTTIGFSRYADAGVNGTNGPQNGSAIFANTESETFSARIPIVGWKTAPFVVASVAGYAQTPGIATSSNQAVDVFSVSYGTTNATTACTASPCSYLDQIGSATSTITRTGTGAYSLNVARTYTKLKCIISSTGVTGTTPVGSYSCAACSALPFSTILTDGAHGVTDSYGTLMCIGNY